MSEAIFLDSSILRGLSPVGAVAIALRELAELGAIEIHISSLVEREVATGLGAKTRVEINTAWVPEPHRTELVKLATGARAIVEQGVADWLDALHVVRHPPTIEECARAFDAYFAGTPPFKVPKNRNDIPDAFILESLRTYAMSTASKRICFVCNDGALLAAAETIPNVEVHQELQALLADVDVKRPASKDELRDACKDQQDELEEIIERSVGPAVLQEELYDSSFPSDHGEATVVGYGNLIDLDWDWSDADVLGTDIIAIPFSCVLETSVLDLFVFKSDYWSLSDEGQARFHVWDADWNDHYMWLQLETDLRVEGTLSVQVVLDTSGGTRTFKLGTSEVTVSSVSLSGA